MWEQDDITLNIIHEGLGWIVENNYTATSEITTMIENVTKSWFSNSISSLPCECTSVYAWIVQSDNLLRTVPVN